MDGYFFTFEGGEGGGKSTQINLLGNYLKQKGYDVVVTREPGGTAGGEAIRHVLLSGAAKNYGTLFEALLFAASRADHVDQVIEPALKEGKIVLCDRYIDSTKVYQGGANGVSVDDLAMLEKIAINDCLPDLTFILDLPASLGMERANNRRGNLANTDRFEKDDLVVQEKRRQAFLQIAADEPQRFLVIDATQTIEDMAKQIAASVVSVLDRKQHARA